MNSSGNNVVELKKEIKSLNQKINKLIDLCQAFGLDESIIYRTLQNNNNSSKRIANQQARFIEQQARNAQQFQQKSYNPSSRKQA